MISEAKRASEVIARLRALSRKTSPERVEVDIKDVIQEVELLIQRELITHRVLLRLDLSQPRSCGCWRPHSIAAGDHESA